MKSKRNPPLSPVLVRALGLPVRLLQTSQLTHFFYSHGDVLAFFCSLSATYLGKSLRGLSGLFLQLLAMGIFSDYGKVYACDQGSLLSCSVVKCLAFLKCCRQCSSKHFSNFIKKTHHFGDISLSSPSPMWSQGQVCYSLIQPAVLVPLGTSRRPLSLTLSRRPDFIPSAPIP